MIARSNTYSARRPIESSYYSNNMTTTNIGNTDFIPHQHSYSQGHPTTTTTNKIKNHGHSPYQPQYTTTTTTNNNNVRRNNSTTVHRSRSINAHIPNRTPSIRQMNQIGSSPYAFANSLATYNKNMEPVVNKNHFMTPFQIQKEKMQKSFIFPNGEVFTPHREFDKKKNVLNIHILPVEPIHEPIVTNATTSTSSPKKNGKFSKFFKGLIRNKSISREKETIKTTNVIVPNVTLTPIETDNNDTILSRLEEQWDTVHLNTSSLINNSYSSPTLHSTSFGSSLSVSLHDDTEDLPHVRFSTEIYMDETYGSDEYERADPEDDGSGENGISNFNNSTIKIEMNQFKRIEMFVHPDSRRNTHFFR
ncbi:hypothetical protein C6P45_000431 [Maudiozyma exigua]|uniref:Uncharacterized protein n=1 Tax=Maudiozyma exigua TaxID=34358 RepID=A0A9P6W6Q9_MAUEX|nr:hypothetical protein C6P45_000431 [Kazachstania exigua]